LTIFATIAVSFLIGSRIAWLRTTASHAQISRPVSAVAGPAEESPPATTKPQANQPSSGKASAKASTGTSTAPAADELVVYEKGKVIFRMKPASPKPESDSIVEAASTTKIATTKTAATKTAATKETATTKIATAKPAQSQSVWLSPAQAETQLLSRTEPQYPPEALAAHRSGSVVLEVQVAEDGSVSTIRTLSGDPVLAAAASAAVRNWRYQPYRQHDLPARFQTDVTLSFTLPN